MAPSMSGTSKAVARKLELARQRKLAPDLVVYGQLIGLLIRAEEVADSYVAQVAKWRAAGHPRSPTHPASDDVLACHDEVTFVRAKIAGLLESPAAEVEREIVRHRPELAMSVVCVHARLAALGRRVVELPDVLRQSRADALRRARSHQEARRVLGPVSRSTRPGTGVVGVHRRA